jgi:hypothetical protein
VTLPPWLLLALLVALAFAFAYQLTTQRFGWRALAYWAIFFLAFLSGEVAAETLGWNLTRFGDLRLVPDLFAVFAVGAVLGYLRL